MKKVLKVNGAEYATNFQYSVLEIADSHTSDEDVLTRETHWSGFSRAGSGYNAN